MEFLSSDCLAECKMNVFIENDVNFYNSNMIEIIINIPSDCKQKYKY